MRWRKLNWFVEANVCEWQPQHLDAHFHHHHHHRWKTICGPQESQTPLPFPHAKFQRTRKYRSCTDPIRSSDLMLCKFLVTTCSGMNSNPFPPWFASSVERPNRFPGPSIFPQTCLVLKPFPHSSSAMKASKASRTAGIPSFDHWTSISSPTTATGHSVPPWRTITLKDL